MRIRTSMLALGLTLGALAAAPAFAAAAQPASSHKPMTAQQEKMATCSHESKGMKGDAHKKFMSDCLHGKTAAAAPAATGKADLKDISKTAAPASAAATSAPASSAKVNQREKMKTCNADAKAKKLKGADRKSFMSTCLKG